MEVPLVGAGGVPASGVGAVSLNVTATEPAAGGFVTVFPCGARELVSSLNYSVGQTVANSVIAPVSASGSVCFFSSAPTHLVVDVNGWFAAGAGYSALSPLRVFDTRPGTADGLRVVPKVGRSRRTTASDRRAVHVARPSETGRAVHAGRPDQLVGVKVTGSRSGPQMPTVVGFHVICPSTRRSGIRLARIGSASCNSARASDAPRQ